MEHLSDLLKTVSDKLGHVAQSQVVVGTPIKVGRVTVVPISRISVAFGVVGGEGSANGVRLFAGRGGTGGTGGGARVRPVGAAIFSDDGVDVLPIPDSKGALDRIFDRIPDIIDLVRDALRGRVDRP